MTPQLETTVPKEHPQFPHSSTGVLLHLTLHPNYAGGRCVDTSSPEVAVQGLAGCPSCNNS